jgi:hypothetical protein
MAQDSKEERLYRDIDGKHYCGLPRLSQIVRNEQIDGCGCELSYKASRVNVSCPLNRWPEVKTILELSSSDQKTKKRCGCGAPKKEN